VHDRCAAASRYEAGATAADDVAIAIARKHVGPQRSDVSTMKGAGCTARADLKASIVAADDVVDNAIALGLERRHVAIAVGVLLNLPRTHAVRVWLSLCSASFSWWAVRWLRSITFLSLPRALIMAWLWPGKP